MFQFVEQMCTLFQFIRIWLYVLLILSIVLFIYSKFKIFKINVRFFNQCLFMILDAHFKIRIKELIKNTLFYNDALTDFVL